MPNLGRPHVNRKWYEFVHKNFDPLMEFVNAISEYPEFEEVRRKLLEARGA
jgi:hypothetical protein